MASALQQNQNFAQGKADVKPIPLAWFTTPGSEKEPALLLPDYGMPKKVGEDGNGFIRVSHEDAVARLKKITHDTTYAPGKPKGQNLYDWYLAQSDTNQEIKSIKEMLVSGGKANSAESFLVNGIFSDKQLAQKVSGMTTQQLMDMGKADQALQTKMQSEQAAEAKRQAEIKTYTDSGKPVPQELLAPGQGEGNGKDGYQVGPGGEQTQASGKPATNVVKQQDGTYAVTDTSGKILQPGFKNIAQALAAQNQITTGGTPQLSGRPDLFAVQPTQAEIDAGIQPIVPQAGMAPVQPKVAELKDLEALQAGTLPTPKAEAATGTLVGSTIDTEGLTDEQIKNADTLANAIASDDSLLYVPKISPADIDGYIASGKLDAAKELDPYYKEIIGRTKETYLQSVLFETKARELSMRQEALNRAKEKKSIQDDLERRGATYTGEASEELGVESALSPELNSVIEGLMQKRQDIVSTSSKQQFEKNIALLTQSAEEQLGTQAVKDITGADTSSLSASLFKVLGTPTMGSIAADQTTNIETRAKELAKGQVAKELAKSSDFPTSEYLKYI